MSPKELYQAIAIDNEYRRNKFWDAAYVLYNLNNDRKLRKGCGSCAQQVKNWLRKFSGHEG